MEKQKLNEFISRYNLSGLINSVKWTSANNKLSTSFISDDKSVVGNVSLDNVTLGDYEFGVYDTNKLKSMVAVMGDDIDLNVVSIGDKPITIKMKDESLSAEFVLSDISVIPKVPATKGLPNFDVTVKLTPSFIGRFIKASSALSDESNFTFMCKGGKPQIVLGHSKINTNKISIDVEAECDDVSPISFSAKFLREILVANKDATNMELKISTHGLSHIKFIIGEFTSEYYLVESKQ